MSSSKTLLTLLAVVAMAFLAAGCSSSSSPVDNQPPEVPSGLVATDADGVVKLTWNDNALDADFAGFKLMKLHLGVETELVADPAEMVQFVDQQPDDGYTTYYLSAVDRSGNQSANAQATVFIGEPEQTYRPFEE